VVAGLLLASASYYIVEMPFLRLKAKYETKRNDAALPVGVRGSPVE
jgi:hypothetical protein